MTVFEITEKIADLQEIRNGLKSEPFYRLICDDNDAIYFADAAFHAIDEYIGELYRKKVEM